MFVCTIFNCVIIILEKYRFWFPKVQNQSLKVTKLAFKITNLSNGSVKSNLPKAHNQVLKVPLSYLSYWKIAKTTFKSSKVVISKAKVHFWNIELALSKPDFAF